VSNVSAAEEAVEESGPQDLAAAVAAAQRWLLDAQAPDGHWCGELEGDTILESEYVLVFHFLGRLSDPRVAKLAAYLRRQQLPGGGWAIYPGGPAEVSASVKAYLALKLAGDAPEAPHMARARARILELGGIEACNSFTKLYLAICGQYDWERCPAVPPEMVLLPRWFYFNLAEISSWSRGIVVPLSIVWALRPSRPVPERAAIPELAAPSPAAVKPRLTGKSRAWRAFFGALDRGLKRTERPRLRPLRERALARAEAWTLARLAGSDGLGAIFPPIVNTIFALVARGYPADHPLVAGQLAELARLEIDDGEAIRLQPCFSAVWDTALAVTALAGSGLPAHHPALAAAGEWLLDSEVRQLGDWSVKVPGAAPGGWAFEYRNPFYPDCDDTAAVLTALSALPLAAPGEPGSPGAAAVERGLAWLLAMQNDDGGWGAFDRGCDREVLTHVPFADHNALLDPSTSDVTGRALESLARLGLGRGAPPVERAVAFLRRQQEVDGAWYGRWGVNYIYGTWLALRGISRGGDISREPWCRRAVAWLQAHQNPDGGWGESPRSYDEPALRGVGESTAAQTAWALLGLCAAGEAQSLDGRPAGGEVVERGVRYLLATQRSDGRWIDEPWTGTGFPRVFYLRYHLYATYFPLMALAEVRRATEPPGDAVQRAAPALRTALAGAPAGWDGQGAAV
jgi:squalene-hopene/tetraprenyl-beta-curcumene cyclase